MLALSIFPASHPASIVDEYELNFCVRDGNRWTLTAINTNCMSSSFLENINYYTTLFSFVKCFFCSPTASTVGLACEELVTRTGFEPMLTA